MAGDSANPSAVALPAALVRGLHFQNPWWDGAAAPTPPAFRRVVYQRLRYLLASGLTPATVLRGPRRVGKTVLLQQVVAALLQEGTDPRRILYVSFDELPTRRIAEPILTIAWWYQQNILGQSFNAAGNTGTPAYIFFDEVQTLDAWAPQLKTLVDTHPVRVLATGSSSLRIEAGRDSLAGRITTLDVGPLLLREIAAMRYGDPGPSGWPAKRLDALASQEFWQEAAQQGRRDAGLRDRAFAAFSEHGAYPVAHSREGVPWEEIADHLNEAVIKRALQHDLLLGPRGQRRDERLLEEVFRICCRYAGQAPGASAFVPPIQWALGDPVTWVKVQNYLRYLDDSMLIRLIRPLEMRLKRQASPAKICLCDHALRASWLQETIPLHPAALAADPQVADLAGHIAESALGYFFATLPNVDVAWYPAREPEPEVDFVLTVGLKHIPVEVKYRGRIRSHEDTEGLRYFLEKAAYNAPFGVLVTLDDDVTVLDPRIVPISLRSLLWMQ